MKNLRYFAAAGAAALAAALTAGSALAVTPILITGKYSGQAATNVDGSTVTIAATGTGKSTVIGAGKIIGNGTGDSSQQPCVPFGRTGTITGVAGTTVTYKLISGAQGCGDEGGHLFSITGTLKK